MPRNCAPLLQLMDQNILQTIGSNYKKKILLDFISGNKEIFLTLKEMTLSDVMFTVAASWNDVSKQPMQSSWKKLWPFAEVFYEEWEAEIEIPLAELLQMVTLLVNSVITESDTEKWFEESPNNEIGIMTFDETLNQTTAQEDCSKDNNVAKITSSISGKLEDSIMAINTSIQWAEQNM